MKKILKNFPLTTYSICGGLTLILYYSLYGINDFDTAPYRGAELKIWLLLMVLFIVPAVAYGFSLFLLKSFDFSQNLEATFAIILVALFATIIDLIILFLRTKLLPKLKSKFTK